MTNSQKILTRPWLIILLAGLMLSILVAACGGAAPEVTSTPTPPAVTGTVEPEESESETEGEEVSSVQDVATAVSERTPVPTSTPDRVDREIERFTTETGLSGRFFLGLSIENWINIGFSVLLVLAAYFVFSRVLRRLPGWISKRTGSEFSDETSAFIANYINWLLLVVLIRFAVLRLDFLGEEFRTITNDLFFIVIVVLVSLIGLDLIRIGVRRYEDSLESAEDQRKLSPFIITAKRVAQSLVLIVALSIMLSHFGFNINIIAAVLIISGFVISFGAQDVLNDVLSGYIILIDQPFRVGDSILIKELDTRGVVLEIGTRSTHLKTGDNREVIVPNSSIGDSQVVNYTYPDSRFRVQTEIGVAYGTNRDQMRQVIEQAVLQVEGVLPDKGVDIYYMAFGGSAREVRVRWWIDHYKNEKRMLDAVNFALEQALDEAGIELPNNTYDLNVKMNE